MHYVYVLESESKSSQRYIGCTDDLKRRLTEHNNKENESTKAGVPWKIIYYEAFLISRDAYSREKVMKGQWERKFLSRVLKNYFKSKSS